MAKKQKTKVGRKGKLAATKKGQAPKGSQSDSKAKRKPAFDVLRGSAIVLMVIDHVAHALDYLIEPTNIRIVTRLSMPLFAILMGYFLVKSQRTNYLRLLQLGIAAVFMSWVTTRAFGQAEILAALFCSAIIFHLTKPIFPIFVVAAFIFAFDPTNAGSGLEWLPITFDYPLTICLSCVALGAVVARCHAVIAIIAAALVAAAGWIVPPPSAYVLIASLPATALLVIASNYGAISIWRSKFATWLGFCGRYPLSIYIVHYVAVIIAIEMMPTK